MPVVQVRLADHRQYPIVVAQDALDQAGAWTRRCSPAKTWFILSNPRVARQYGGRLARSLQRAGLRSRLLLVPEGESSKSLAQAERLMGKLLVAGCDRGGGLMALGGGVIGDLTGFVAATYMRGVDFIQVPTTLLAQVDSAVGGKVAVNHPLGKNVIGAFYQPKLVVSDPACLATLSARQLRCGLAEIIKIAAVADPKFFLFLEEQVPKLLQRDTKTLQQAIVRSCSLKAGVVEADERDHGRRAILNYGHTLGHALEAYHHYQKYLHGEAVAVGMAAAARLAVAKGLCTPKTAARQERLLDRTGLPVRLENESIDKLLTLMKNDKKARGGELNFVLTPKIGRASLCNNLTPFSVRRVLETLH